MTHPDPPSDNASGLTHLDESGRPHMVDVTDKTITSRRAVAEGWIRMAPGTLEKLVRGGPKGEPLRVAELGGIQAAKRTSELIPLCHLLAGVTTNVELTPDSELPGIRARAISRVQGTTGVEMEALTAVSVSLLTLYDMGKAIDRGMMIGGIALTEKSGGRSGHWVSQSSA